MAVPGAPDMSFPAFPFEPYPIQLQFMRAVYSGIQKGGVTIVESPTGTGKTLSLICSALQWLIDQHEDLASPADGAVNVTGSAGEEPDWMSNFETRKEEERRKRKEARRRTLKQRLAQSSSLKKNHGKSSVMTFGVGKESREGNPSLKAREWLPSKAVPGIVDDDDFIVDDYFSDQEAAAKEGKRKLDLADSSSSSGDDMEENSDDEEPLKVYFCSRTHSQLSQFVRELQRTMFSSSLRSVTLGSRKNLCINPAVAALGSSARINDKCLELQKKHKSGSGQSKIQTVPQKGHKKVTTKGGCPMMNKQKLQKRYVSEAVEAGALDIEDLLSLGSKLGTCPYYGSRRMVPISDLVVLPYQSVLHAGTREALGISLKNCVVVIDEAHNLVDTVSDVHSCKVTADQMKQVHSQLTEYLDKFRRRLAASNRRYIEMLLVLVGSFLRLLSVTKPENEVSSGPRMMTINDFLFSLNIDNLNLFKIGRYMKESNIVHKVSSYGETVVNQVITETTTSNRSSMAGFHVLAEFVMALTNADADGRVLLTPKTLKSQVPDSPEDGALKFIMLNAAKHFAEVLDQARAVVLAGGTLQPIQELKQRLLPHLAEDRFHVFSCGHIVPPESILPLAIAKGPGNRLFNFTYNTRSSPPMIEELGRLMNNVCTIVPEGIVLFFPSFEYESLVFNSWQSAGTLSAIEVKKTVFREPRDAGAVEEVLQQYRDCIAESKEGTKKTGALLMCVVGGKMSEGINFSDGMGRCVVMVGLPYPSPTDPELVERMKYIDLLVAADHNGACGGRQSKEYYENLCMKAVNQSIGRAIRHIKDYAAILLVDARYASDTSGPTSKLPGWILQRLVKVTGSFGEVHRQLHQFFRYNRQLQSAE
ncbi:hypothetical protein R1sor_012895 [Riccia sorocarpa]|uniref:Helicase ATP-binding domain-containing protein n=1 Tax=Riccia sorocarpa TaxID=122646 RepID=A0ABD3I8F7_9MARC